MSTPSSASPRVTRPVIPVIVQQHAEEAAMLRHIRSVLVRAPHVRLLQLERIDERIAAHLDGLAVAGDAGLARCIAALESPGTGEVFALAVRALEARQPTVFAQVLALVQALPAAQRGAASALGWVSASTLQGVVRELLASEASHQRALGLAACRMHRVDPGQTLPAALSDRDPGVRSAALRCAGELGRADLLAQTRAAISDDHPDVVFWAAWAACLLGERHASLRVLAAAARSDSPQADRALTLVLLASPFDAAREFARSLSAAAAQGRPADRRRVLRAIGLLGDARFVPWLIEQMENPTLTRLAGEAFSWITGADLARQDLETLQAPPLPEHPSDDPDDDDVSLDEDESLPWPDLAKVRTWWSRQNALQTAAATGTRLFAGEPAGAAAAARVLVEGTQRLRSVAALWKGLLVPGQGVFPVAAPTPRQRRWLAAATPGADR